MTVTPGNGRRPNIIFLLVDDMGWRDLSCQGSRFYRTPNIDRLAAQSLRFDHAYAACPVCSPTRASILTGRYPATLNLTDYIPGRYQPYARLLSPTINWHLPLDEHTVAQMMKEAGYVTGHVGKWHLGRGDYTSPRYGFDHVVEKAPSDNDKMTSGLTSEAIRFIETHQDKPFFLYFAHYAVHLKIEAKPELIEKYRGLMRPDDPQDNPAYAAMIEHLDTSVGRLMDRLDELGLAEDTVLIFFSDNGGLLEHQGTRITSNLPLRGGKGMLYEGGIREPLFVRYPRLIQAGRTCSVPVTSVDFLPTMLDLAAAKVQPRNRLDGVSLMPLLAGRGMLSERALYWHYPHYHHEKPSGALRQGRHKLIEWFEDGRLELFDLIDDPGETNNLALAMPALASGLQTQLAHWRRMVGARMPTVNPDFDPLRTEEQVVPPGWTRTAASMD
jgi:arylsulfatase A